MNPPTRTDGPRLPLSLDQLIEQVCGPFEAALKATSASGHTPRVEDYLSLAQGAERSAVLRELILLEVHYRRRRGESPQPSEYRARFPELDPEWLTAVLATAPTQELRPLGDVPVGEGPGTLIGPYKLLQQIGQGGMGTVFLAEQLHPVQRQVALKLIRPGLDSRQVLARFEAERQALAMMDHPNIAKVFDAGTIPSPLPLSPAAGERGRGEGVVLGGVSATRPYFVMELVRGVPITEYCDSHHLTPRQRLQLFIPVCQAVQHAHQKGIIHRDLKPSNVVTALYDDRPMPKVIDFGVAKATGLKLTEDTLTELGSVVGTVEYMSPEQAEPGQPDIDTRSDIYSLGVVLYELLTGTTPLQARRLQGAALLDLLRRIREDEPPTPSMRLDQTEQLATIAANRGLEPKKLRGLVRGELDWMVMKCLEKDRTRRYETANALARDIERYLNEEPLEAGPPSAGYRLRKFARKHRRLLATTAAFVFLVLVGAGLSAWLGVRAMQQRDRAEHNLRLARQAVDNTVTKISGNAELKQANFHQLRRDLLADAVPFYQQFVQQRANDPELMVEHGRAWHSLAYLRNELGEKETARSDYEHMQAIFAQLTADFPTVPQYRQELARSHNNLGMILRDLGKRTEAETAYRHALKIQVQLAQNFPTMPEYRRDLARSQHNLGRLLRDLGRRTEAESAYRDALNILSQLAQDFPAVSEYRQGLAGGHNNLGNLLVDWGKPTEAESAYRDALKIQTQLAQDFPAVSAYRQELARSHLNLGALLRDLGKRAEAESAYHDALKIQAQLAQSFPAVPEYRQELARSHSSLAVLLRDLGKRAEAETAFRDALEVQTQLSQAFPGIPEYRQELARSHNSLGILLYRAGRRAEAETTLREALRIKAQLAQDFPAMPAYRRELATTHDNLGVLLVDLGKRVEAETAYRDALNIRSQLAQEFPTVPGYAHELATTLKNLAELAVLRQELAQARQLLEQALPHRQVALRADPKNAAYRQAFRAERSSLGPVLAGLGDHGAAAAVAEELAGLGWDPASDCYDAACTLSRCVPMVERDTKLGAAERQKQSQMYTDRALELLHQAVAKGFHNAAHMKQDEDLKSLRTHPEFQRLLKELESKASPQAK